MWVYGNWRSIARRLRVDWHCHLYDCNSPIDAIRGELPAKARGSTDFIPDSFIDGLSDRTIGPKLSQPTRSPICCAHNRITYILRVEKWTSVGLCRAMCSVGYAGRGNRGCRTGPKPLDSPTSHNEGGGINSGKRLAAWSGFQATHTMDKDDNQSVK